MFNAVRRIFTASFFAAGMISAPVSAALLPVGTTPADDVIFNFDLTAVALGSPLVEIVYEAVLSPVGASGSVAVDLFADLNAANLLSSTSFSAALIDYVAFSQLGAITDGRFSVGFRATPGSVANFPSTSAFGIRLICDMAPIPNCTTAQSAFVNGQLVQPGAVPEPGSLALLAIGAAAIMGTRRERTLKSRQRA